MRHSHATIAAIVVMALLAGACATGGAFKRGDTAARAGDWDAAVVHYRQAVQSDPDNVQYKIALERAMLHDPRLMLLDEPFTGLDGVSAAALAARLRSLAADGRIVIMATHEVEFADDVLTRAVILQDGRLAADVPGADWRRAYRDVVRRES